MNRSDEQRRAIFANLRTQSRPRPIAALQKRARSFARKNPLLGEIAIGVPAIVAGAYISRKTRSFPKIAARLGQYGRVRRAGTVFATEIPLFMATDVAVRRATMGPKRHQPEPGLGSAVVGAAVADTAAGGPLYGLARRIGAPVVRRAVKRAGIRQAVSLVASRFRRRK